MSDKSVVHDICQYYSTWRYIRKTLVTISKISVEIAVRRFLHPASDSSEGKVGLNQIDTSIGKYKITRVKTIIHSVLASMPSQCEQAVA